MKTKPEKQTPTADQILSDFTHTCNKLFAFLETKYGLPLQEAEQIGHEFVVVYSGAKYSVTIYLEYPGPPWIAIVKKDGKRSKRKGLHQLYKRAFKKDLPNSCKRQKNENKQYDLTNLPVLSEILRNHWSELVAAF